MDEIYKEDEQVVKKEVGNLSLEKKNKEIEGKIILENPKKATNEDQTAIKDELLVLRYAAQAQKDATIITQLHVFYNFLNNHNGIDSLPGYDEYEIGPLLFSFVEQEKNSVIRHFALRCISLLVGDAPIEIINEMIDNNIIELLCDLLIQPYFEGKELIFLALGNLIDFVPGSIARFTAIFEVEKLIDIAIECQVISNTEYMQYLFYILSKHINLTKEQSEMFSDFFFLAFAKGIGLKYAILGYSILINQQEEFSVDILEPKFVLKKICLTYDNTRDGVIFAYLMKLIADLSVKEIYLHLDITKIFIYLNKYEESWFCCKLLDSLTVMIQNYPQDFIQYLLENDVFSALSSIQCRDFNEKMIIIKCLSQLLLMINDQDFINICDKELIEFIFFGIESEQEEAILICLNALHRIVSTYALSYIVSESDIMSQIDDLAELDQNAEIEAKAQEIISIITSSDK